MSVTTIHPGWFSLPRPPKADRAPIGASDICRHCGGPLDPIQRRANGRLRYAGVVRCPVYRAEQNRRQRARTNGNPQRLARERERNALNHRVMMLSLTLDPTRREDHLTRKKEDNRRRRCDPLVRERDRRQDRVRYVAIMADPVRRESYLAKVQVKRRRFWEVLTADPERHAIHKAKRAAEARARRAKRFADLPALRWPISDEVMCCAICGRPFTNHRQYRRRPDETGSHVGHDTIICRRCPTKE